MENEVSGNEICPKCERKRLYYRGAFKTWRCAKCKSFFDINKTVHLKDWIKSLSISFEFK